jgi:hypothetical protein
MEGGEKHTTGRTDPREPDGAKGESERAVVSAQSYWARACRRYLAVFRRDASSPWSESFFDYP